MINSYRTAFNAAFTAERYEAFQRLLTERCGVPIAFRCAETPCFFEAATLEAMIRASRELVAQLLGSSEYLARATEAIPEAFRVPGTDPAPLFVQADFGLDGAGQPKLVEIQGFPSLYAFQPVLAEAYRDAFGLDSSLETYLERGTAQSNHAVLSEALCGDYDPREVFLLEVAPQTQKTLPDFVLTEKRYGVRTLDVQEVVKRGKRLFAPDGTPIKRLYNRVIVDEVVRKSIPLPFDFRDELDLEWAGHPNWYFLLSKFSLPFLDHPSVPKTSFLSDVTALPENLEDFVLKPLFSFAGLGVKVGPTKADIAEVADPTQWILQERVNFIPTIETPEGPTKVEVRVMLVRVGEHYQALT
ncbi:hypothetical protein, partial [Armatimonas sp.]|uniref:hypothetical protein n=1 Tax=Armatimonas sp. TaxID=1872638 RepID=UPI00286CD013